MEKGISKHWTSGKEIEFEELIKGCRSFAQRHLTMLLRDVLKYDGRSKEGKRAMVQARLRFATATDKDIEELAELEARMQSERPGEIPGLSRSLFEKERLSQLKKEHTQIKEKGINKEEIRCQ